MFCYDSVAMLLLATHKLLVEERCWANDGRHQHCRCVCTFTIITNLFCPYYMRLIKAAMTHQRLVVFFLTFTF